MEGVVQQTGTVEVGNVEVVEVAEDMEEAEMGMEELEMGMEEPVVKCVRGIAAEDEKGKVGVVDVKEV